MSTTPTSVAERSELVSLIDRYRDDKGAVIGLLQDIQAEYNYLPKVALIAISRELEIPLSHIYSLATFYRAFSLHPRGKHHICVCLGTACHVKGGFDILDKFRRDLGIDCGQTTKDGLFSLEEVRCVGACSLAPIFTVRERGAAGERTYGRMSQNAAARLMRKLRRLEKGATDNGGDEE